MKKKLAILTSIITTLLINVAVASPLYAVSNEIGDFKQYTWNTGISGYKDGTWVTINNDNAGWLVLNGTINGVGINLGQTIPVEKGNIATFSIVLIAIGGIQDIQTTPPAYCLLSSNQWVVVDCQTQFQMIQDTEYNITNLYADLKYSDNFGGLSGNIQPTLERQNIAYAVYTFNYKVRFSSNDTSINRLQLDGVLSRGAGVWLGKISSISFATSMEQGAMQANDQQKQEGQQAQNDGQTGANQSQQQTEATGTTMLQTAGNIVGILTDTQAGSCIINGNMGNINLGQMNFCQGDIGPLRPVITIIVNLIFGIATFKIFIFLIGIMLELFAQFTGGKVTKGE